MGKLYESLIKNYKETGWHVSQVSKLILDGTFDKDEANELFQSGYITISRGMHGKLIVLNKEKMPSVEEKINPSVQKYNPSLPK